MLMGEYQWENASVLVVARKIMCVDMDGNRHSWEVTPGWHAEVMGVIALDSRVTIRLLVKAPRPYEMVMAAIETEERGHNVHKMGSLGNMVNNGVPLPAFAR